MFSRKWNVRDTDLKVKVLDVLFCYRNRLTLKGFVHRGYLVLLGKVIVTLVITCANELMSCPKPSKSTQKRKLQDFECDKPTRKKMAFDSYTSIKDFGYKFNEEGRLVNIESCDGFIFEVTDDHSYNQKNYEMLGEVITEYIYELLQSEEVALKKLEIPVTKESSILSFTNKKKSKDKAGKGFIFASENFDKSEKLLVLVHGSGVVRAGQWARRLIINDCLEHGTQIPYIKQAIKEGYGVLVTNTNQNEVLVESKGKKTYKPIKESESPERHFSYVWKNIIEKTSASKIFVVAHSYGGYLVVDYFTRFPKILDRVVAVAFTDSVHNLSFHSKTDARKWFLKNSVNWVTSNTDLNTPMMNQDDERYFTRLSAGTTKHEETSWKAMESVFQYFHNHGVDFNRPADNEKSAKGDTKNTSKGKVKNAADKPGSAGSVENPDISETDQITKDMNKKEEIASTNDEDSVDEESKQEPQSNIERNKGENDGEDPSTTKISTKEREADGLTPDEHQTTNQDNISQDSHRNLNEPSSDNENESKNHGESTTKMNEKSDAQDEQTISIPSSSEIQLKSTVEADNIDEKSSNGQASEVLNSFVKQQEVNPEVDEERDSSCTDKQQDTDISKEDNLDQKSNGRENTQNDTDQKDVNEDEVRNEVEETIGHIQH